MSVIKFRYRRESGPLGWVHRPVASVILESASQRLEALMYVDSGADITTIPFGAGVALGLEQTAEDRLLEMRGISGGGVPYLTKNLRLGFKGLTLEARVAWALIEEVPFLLGRLDVFSRFNVIFRERNGLVLFAPVR